MPSELRESVLELPDMVLPNKALQETPENVVFFRAALALLSRSTRGTVVVGRV